MSNEPIVQDDLQYFLSKNGEVPFWDHPLMKGYRKLPDDYYPYTSTEQVLSSLHRKQIEQEDMTLLKVVGDAVAANEDQIRRYTSALMSRSETSKRLDRLRKKGFVDRWKCRLEQDESISPPAPFTLGIAGYRLINHFYGENSYMNPDTWDRGNAKMLQRYVGMNELRCLLIDQKAISNWQWNVKVSYNNRFKKPLGVAQVRTPKGEMTFMMERPQMSQNFVGFLRDKLNEWQRIYEGSNNSFSLTGFDVQRPIVVLFASTVKMAEFIHEKLMVDTFPYRIWFCVEELLEEGPLGEAFYAPEKERLKRMKIPFLCE